MDSSQRVPAMVDLSESRRRLLVPVFTAGQRQWNVGDVLAVAPLLSGERKSMLPGAGRMKLAAVDDAAVDAAVQAFRYAHGLVSAQECLTWLAARALSFADLRASVRRRLSGGDATTETLAQIDLLLSDDFRPLARALAARVAAAVERQQIIEGAALECWQQIDASYRAHLVDKITDEARDGMLAQDRRQWLQVDCEVVEFDRIDAAREARHCVAQDGQSLAEIAALGGFAHRSGRWWVSELPGTWSQALFQIRPGMVSGVIAEGERQLLLGFTRLIEPSRADPLLAARLEETLVEQQVRILLTRHVHWALGGLS